jgi:lysophospholipase L1-like esterase
MGAFCMIYKLLGLMVLLLIFTSCTSTATPATHVVGSEAKPETKILSTATDAVSVNPGVPQQTMKPPPTLTPLPTSTVPQPSASVTNRYDADDGRIQFNGRFDFQDPKAPAFDWSATSIEFSFSGTSLTILLQDGRNSYNVLIDSQPQVLKTEMGVETYLLAENLASGRHHAVISKRTEAYVGAAEFKGLIIDGGELEQPPTVPSRLIEFIGDSITTGYGNEGESPNCWFTPDTQNADQTYAAMTAREFDAAYTLIALSGLGVIRNLRADSTDSAETAIDFIDRALGLNPFVTWPSDMRVPNAVVINLGTNDYSSEPFPDDEEFIIAYMELLSAVRTRYPEAEIFAIAGPLMLSPASRMIETAVERFQTANGDDQVAFVFIENILESSAVDFGCDFHPNVHGHRKIADQLIAGIADQLGW